MSIEIEVGKKFARLTTNAVVRMPGLWRLFRGPLRLQFERLASRWSSVPASPGRGVFELALEAVGQPRRILDLGTGTGTAARLLASRFPDADVVGVDLAEGMVAEARRLTPADFRDRLRFEQADAAALPFAEDSFDLVTLANMIPFFDELARVTAPGGALLVAFSAGPRTPIYVPPDRLRTRLAERGFTEFADFSLENGNALVAKKS